MLVSTEARSALQRSAGVGDVVGVCQVAGHEVQPRDSKSVKVPLFAEWSKRELNQIATVVTEVEAPAGTRLAAIGKAGHELFIIVEGEARGTTQPGRATSLRPGNFFGEMSLLDGEPRSATVEATTPIRLL